jgi:hypothetical protein
MVRELERSLGISQRQAERIIADDLGEPIVVAAKAMQMPTDVLHRILLLMNPRVGQSIDRVYELVDLYRETSVDAARRLIAIVRDADRPPAARPQHEPLLWQAAAENARQALAQISHRAFSRRTASAVEPAPHNGARRGGD